MNLGRPARMLSVLLLFAGTSPAGSAAATTVPPEPPRKDTGWTASTDAVPARPARADAESAPLRVQLAKVTPEVAIPGRPVTMTVRITNSSPGAVRGVLLRIRGGDRALRTREEVRRWDTEALAPGALRTMLERPIPGSIASGSTATVSVQLSAGPLPSDPYGAAPLELAALTADRSAQRRTFLPYFRIKEYTPLDLAFAAPLTADADPAYFSASMAERTAAWSKLLGPAGRLTRVLDGAAGAPVTLLVDPAVVGADRAEEQASTPQAPVRSPAPASREQTTPGGSSGTPPAPARKPIDGSDESQQTQRLQAALAARLQAGREGHPLWLLPNGDPDLSALATLAHSGELLRRLLGPSATPLGSGVPRVAWPVAPLDDVGRNALSAAYGDSPPAAYLTPVGTLDHGRGSQAAAPYRDSGGQLVLGYDEELSRLWGALEDRPAAAETTQRFLAETAALLAQSPSRRRSVLVVAPRLFDADPDAQQAFFAAVLATPWVNAIDTDALMRAGQPGASGPTIGAPGDAPFSPFTGADLRLIEDQQRELNGLSSILTRPDPAVRALQAGADALAATVWRWNPAAWARLRAAQVEAVRRYVTGVSVRPSTVNFFADSGVLQLTVVNELDGDVRDLTLTLNPEGRASRLRILTQPDPIQIRRNSRTTVRATVEAIAAGAVPVSTRLSTPAGTTLGNDATVRVTVQPTNGWAVLAIGGLAGVVFVAGLYRTLRGGKPRMTSAELDRIDLT